MCNAQEQMINQNRLYGVKKLFVCIQLAPTAIFSCISMVYLYIFFYLISAFIAMELSVLLFVWLVLCGVPVWLVYQRFLQMAVTAIIFSTILSVYLYVRALSAPNIELASGGNSGW